MENETFKFKNFELTLESGGGESHLEIDNNSQKVFFSFKFSKEDNLSSKFLEIKKNLFIKLIFLAGVLGFEPRYAGIKTLCLNHLATPQKSIHSMNMKQTSCAANFSIFCSYFVGLSMA